MELYFFLLALLSGIFVKLVDYIEDDSTKKNNSRFILGPLYGILIRYLVSQAPFSMIFLAALLSQLFMGKVDAISHKIAYVFIFISILYFGSPQIYIIPLVVFFVFASLDEIDKLFFWSKPKLIQDLRPFLEVAALFFVILSQPYYLFGILAFDLGYLATTRFTRDPIK